MFHNASLVVSKSSTYWSLSGKLINETKTKVTSKASDHKNNNKQVSQEIRKHRKQKLKLKLEVTGTLIKLAAENTIWAKSRKYKMGQKQKIQDEAKAEHAEAIVGNTSRGT